MKAKHARSSFPARRFDRTRTTAQLGASVAALGVLLVAVPAALLRWSEWPITAVPTWAQVQDVPTTAVTDNAILAVLTLGLWACWAIFAVSVVAEAVAQARGGTRARVNIGGPLQRVAGRLVGSLVVCLTSFGALSGPGGAGHPALAALAAQSPLALPPGPAAVASAPASDYGGPGVLPAGEIVALPVAVSAGPGADIAVEVAPPVVVTVERGDSPWSLAETHLGDGMRWRELWDINQTRPQPGGETWSDPKSAILPGWSLMLPKAVEEGDEDAAPAPAVQPEAPAGPADALPEAEVTVEPGDNLWELAESRLQEAWGRPPTDAEVLQYWQGYVEENRDRLLPPHDPGLIYPGQALLAPAAPDDPSGAAPILPPEAPPPDAEASPAEPPPPADPPVEEAPAPPEAPPDAEAPAPPVEEAPPLPEAPPEAEAPAPPGAEAPPDASTPPSSEVGAPPPAPEGTAVDPPIADDLPADQTASSEADGGGGSLLPIGLVGGGIALAGVVFLLDRKRRAQQRHRGYGRDIAMPPLSIMQDERDLRGGADLDGVELLDAALRAAAAGSGATGFPPLRWVEMNEESLLLVLESAASAPACFTAVDDTQWITYSTLEKLTDHAGEVEMPVPTLIPVGATPEKAEVLIELEASGVVSVTGPPDDVTEVLRALAVAAATSPWSEQATVLLVGMHGELSDLHWVKTAPDLATALTTVEAHVERMSSALWSMGCQDTAQARVSSSSPGKWAPVIVISATRPNLKERERLAPLVRRARHGVAVVVPWVAGWESGSAPPGRTLELKEDGWLRIDGLDVLVWPHRLDEEDAEIIKVLFDVADQLEDVPREEAARAVPAVRRPADETAPAAPQPAQDPAPAAVAPPEAVAPGASDVPQPGPIVAGPPAPAAPAAPPASAPIEAPAVRGIREPRRLDAVVEDVEVVVKVLGEVEAVRLQRGTGKPAEERLMPVRQKGLEAVAYLALRESAVDREELEINLFPDGANASKTVYNTVSSARALVGDDLLPAPESGRYELSERVVTDYGIFCELADQAEEIDDVERKAVLLSEALGLVRGEPFTGVGRSYAWVGPHRGMIVAQVVDAAEVLAELRLAAGDWRAAEWAARRGLRAFPSDERMYRLLMRAARAAGNIPGVHRVFRELCDVIADPDLGVEPEDTIHPDTITLLEELTGRPRHSRTA